MVYVLPVGNMIGRKLGGEQVKELANDTGLKVWVVPVEDLLSSSIVNRVRGGEQLLILEGEVGREYLSSLELSSESLNFCLLLQNHTRTSSGSRPSSSEMASIICRFGRASFWKYSSSVSRVWDENTARFFLLRGGPRGSRVVDVTAWGLSVSISHLSRTILMAAAFEGLNCICSNRLIVLWAKLLYPLSARDWPTAP